MSAAGAVPVSGLLSGSAAQPAGDLCEVGSSTLEAAAATLYNPVIAPRVLIVDDDLDLTAELEVALRRYGFETEAVNTRAAALDLASAVDLVLMDLSLPDGDGLEICARLAAQTALVVVSGRADEIDRVAALELGADDYLTKPFGSRELVARCRAVLRRKRAVPDTRSVAVRVGDLEVDFERYEARLQGRPLSLTTKEIALLVVLARRPGVLIRREELAEDVWGTTLWAVNRSLDVHMSSLRRKLGDSPHHPRYIQTAHGLGFRLLPQGSSADSSARPPAREAAL
jgi:DNA-binding response OmpR family regulator